MLRNKPNLPKVIEDISGYIYNLEITFSRNENLCYIQYYHCHYDDFELLEIGGNPMQVESEYIDDAWDLMLDKLRTYGFLED